MEESLAGFGTLDTTQDELASPAVPRLDKVETQDYTDHRIDNAFSQVEGVVVLPVAARVSAYRLIRLHGGYGTRKCRWTTSRSGKPPVIPAANDTAEDLFLGSKVVTNLPTPNRAGTYDWTVSGEYEYVQKVPRYAGVSAFPVGNYPFLIDQQTAAATQILAPIASSYTGPLPFQSLISAAEDLALAPGGVINWPLLALPSVFSSTHIIGG